jgi:hypothetical protein
LVAGADAVGYEEGHSAGVVGEDVHGAVGGFGGAALDAADLVMRSKIGRYRSVS